LHEAGSRIERMQIRKRLSGTGEVCMTHQIRQRSVELAGGRTALLRGAAAAKRQQMRHARYRAFALRLGRRSQERRLRGRRGHDPRESQYAQTRMR
jgi:hypothetical protein